MRLPGGAEECGEMSANAASLACESLSRIVSQNAAATSSTTTVTLLATANSVCVTDFWQPFGWICRCSCVGVGAFACAQQWGQQGGSGSSAEATSGWSVSAGTGIAVQQVLAVQNSLRSPLGHRHSMRGTTPRSIAAAVNQTWQDQAVLPMKVITLTSYPIAATLDKPGREREVAKPQVGGQKFTPSSNERPLRERSLVR